MRLFSSILMATALCMVANAGKEHHKMKKWAMMKACESCFGQEAMKAYMVKIKTASAKCMKVDAPELDLPIFKAPYRTVTALVDGAFAPNDPHYGSGMHHGGRPQYHGAQGQYPHGKPEAWMKKVFFQKMMQMFFEDDFVGVDDEESDGDMSSMSSMGMGQGSRRGAMKYFKKRRNHQDRYRRQAADAPVTDKKEMFEIGERLNAKLEEAKAKMEQEIATYKCMLQECGVMTSEGVLASVDELKESMNTLPIKDQWLKDNIDEDIEICHEFASNVPQSVLEDCNYGPELAKIKMFKKCLKMNKMRTCMNYDIKQQLESNFGGSLETLVENTQMEEDDLLGLVQTLLQGPEMDL